MSDAVKWAETGLDRVHVASGTVWRFVPAYSFWERVEEAPFRFRVSIRRDPGSPMWKWEANLIGVWTEYDDAPTEHEAMGAALAVLAKERASRAAMPRRAAIKQKANAVMEGHGSMVVSRVRAEDLARCTLDLVEQLERAEKEKQQLLDAAAHEDTVCLSHPHPNRIEEALCSLRWQRDHARDRQGAALVLLSRAKQLLEENDGCSACEGSGYVLSRECASCGGTGRDPSIASFLEEMGR